MGVFVRARQRSRTALRAFTPSLSPVGEEVGIDRWQLNVKGNWRTPDGPDAFSGSAVAELLTLKPVDPDWFRSPARRGDSMMLATKRPAPTTLGDMEFKVDVRGGRDGALSVWLKNANVTRTLAHLLADYGDQSDFLDIVGRLGPIAFFSQASRSIPRSFGGVGDNWLADADLVRERLGADPFGAFLPVYIDQLQRCIATLFGPPIVDSYCSDGTDIVAGDDDIMCRWAWGNVRVPQIEVYFERHHARAIGAVRAAATVALGNLDRVNVRRYANMESDFIERHGDCLSIGTDLNETYRLKVYAKSRSRIRFEVVRLSTGDYGSLPRPRHARDRLLSIMQMERDDLTSAVRWPHVGQLFDEQPLPQTDDVVRLFSLIASACVKHQVAFEPVMARLLEDGGACLNSDETLPDALLLELCRNGVLTRHIVRRQDHRQPNKRYALTRAYRNLAQIIRASLGGND